MYSKRIKSILSDRIRVFRNSKGWTQERLAEAIDVHSTYVSRIESGKKLPTLTTVCKIAEVFQIRPYELLIDDTETSSLDYKRRKLINIISESKSRNIEIYSIFMRAFHNKG